MIRRRQYARLTSRMRKIITNGNSLPRKRTRLFGTMQSIYRTVKSKGIKKLQAGNSNNRMTMARKSPILLSKFLFINRKSPWSFILSVVSDSFSVFSFLPYPANDATVRKSVKKANRYFCSFSCSTLFSFHGVADGGFEESQLYYTTPQTKKQAGNTGNAREKRRESLIEHLLSGESWRVRKFFSAAPIAELKNAENRSLTGPQKRAPYS